MKRIVISLTILLFISLNLWCQNSDSTSTLSFMFIGDIMGHDTQINAAYDEINRRYDYDDCFKYVKPLISEVDVAVANLEVTLAGPPYKGYPNFSSPDELAVALKNAGIDILATANNHSCDRHKKGILRTIDVLDSLQIKHTGTFRDSAERADQYPMIIEKNGIRIALLNYTYGTNGIPTPEPTIVNRIDVNTIDQDIKKAKESRPDAIIVFFHWGKEYMSSPDKNQEYLTKYCINRGAHYVIGSHPHVIQKIEWIKDSINNNENFTAYSLGNYISNMRKRRQDGGLMLRMEFIKNDTETRLTESGYYLAYVYRPLIYDQREFFMVPVSQYENNPDFFSTDFQYNKMNIFIEDSRKLMQEKNTGVYEYVWKEGHWQLAK